MNDLQRQVRRFILQTLEARLEASATFPADPPDEFSLVESGVVDSMGFLELVGQIEEAFRLEVDFEGADPEEFTTLGGLARCAACGRDGSPGGSDVS